MAYPSLSEFVEAYTEKEIGEDSTKWDAYVTKYNTYLSTEKESAFKVLETKIDSLGVQILGKLLGDQL